MRYCSVLTGHDTVPVRSTERFFKVQALSCAWMAVSRWRIAVRLLGGGVGWIRILMIPYCAVHTLPPYRTVPYSERRVVLNFVQPLPRFEQGGAKPQSGDTVLVGHRMVLLSFFVVLYRICFFSGTAWCLGQK